jgi:hypothetical protein
MDDSLDLMLHQQQDNIKNKTKMQMQMHKLSQYKSGITSFKEQAFIRLVCFLAIILSMYKLHVPFCRDFCKRSGGHPTPCVSIDFHIICIQDKSLRLAANSWQQAL